MVRLRNLTNIGHNGCICILAFVFATILLNSFMSLKSKHIRPTTEHNSFRENVLQQSALDNDDDQKKVIKELVSVKKLPPHRWSQLEDHVNLGIEANKVVEQELKDYLKERKSNIKKSCGDVCKTSANWTGGCFVTICYSIYIHYTLCLNVC